MHSLQYGNKWYSECVWCLFSCECRNWKEFAEMTGPEAGLYSSLWMGKPDTGSQASPRSISAKHMHELRSILGSQWCYWPECDLWPWRQRLGAVHHRWWLLGRPEKKDTSHTAHSDHLPWRSSNFHWADPKHTHRDIFLCVFLSKLTEVTSWIQYKKWNNHIYLYIMDIGIYIYSEKFQKCLKYFHR